MLTALFCDRRSEPAPSDDGATSRGSLDRATIDAGSPAVKVSSTITIHAY